jgi:hypothetical protein
VFLANTGKTPALNVDQRISYRTLPKDVPFSPKYPTPPERIGVIQPASRFKWETPVTEKALKEQIGTYQTGDNVLYLFGEVAYDDIFGTQRHHSEFCMFMLKHLGTFVDCPTHNNAD